MRYSTDTELSQFHDALLNMFKKHAINTSEERWGYPSGFIDCETFQFNTKLGDLYIGHDDRIEKNRWWIPIASEDLNFGNEFHISFEMSIPKTHNAQLSVHYAIENNKIIHILHKGKFTAGYAGLRMEDFVNYYRNNPGRWQLLNFSGYDYLEFAKLNLKITDTDFDQLIESLAEFTKYIPNFKNLYR